MMSATELKQKLTNQILKIDDVDFLSGLVNLLENNSPNDFYELTAYQEKRIEEARQQFKEGKTLSNEEVQEKVRKWMNSK